MENEEPVTPAPEPAPDPVVWQSTTVEGTEYRYTDAAAFAARLKKPGLHVKALPTIPKLSTPQPRREKTAGDYLRRVQKAIKVDDKTRELASPFLGKRFTNAEGTWRFDTTDGHRAVLCGCHGDEAPFEQKVPTWLAQRSTTRVTLTPDFHLCVQRMKAAGPASDPWTILRLDPDSSSLRVSTKDGAEVEASDWLVVDGQDLCHLEVRVNTKYLDDALGRWPAELRLGGPMDPVAITTDAGAVVYILMPIGTDRAKDVDEPTFEVWFGQEADVAKKKRTTKKIRAKVRSRKPAPAPAVETPVIHGEKTDAPVAEAQSGSLLQWRYSWTDSKTKSKVEGTIEAVNEKQARAAIRARYGFEKWLPDRTTIEKIAS